MSCSSKKAGFRHDLNAAHTTCYMLHVLACKQSTMLSEAAVWWAWWAEVKHWPFTCDEGKEILSVCLSLCSYGLIRHEVKAVSMKLHTLTDNSSDGGRRPASSTRLFGFRTHQENGGYELFESQLQLDVMCHNEEETGQRRFDRSDSRLNGPEHPAAESRSHDASKPKHLLHFLHHQMQIIWSSKCTL